VSRRVIIHADAAALAEAVSVRLLTKLIELLATQPTVHLCLTGGSSGINLLRVTADSPRLADVDWSRVHFWWGDDRYVPEDHADRNAKQARDALLNGLVSYYGLPEANIHPLPALDVFGDIETAARAAAADLADFGMVGRDFPVFDICFLGVGPDGHVASLFPGHPTVRESMRSVISEVASPKPPHERLSLTMPVLNASTRVWFVLAGADKSSALGLALAGANPLEVPASGVEGTRTTIFFVDQAAATDVPYALIAPDDEWTGVYTLPE